MNLKKLSQYIIIPVVAVLLTACSGTHSNSTTTPISGASAEDRATLSTIEGLPISLGQESSDTSKKLKISESVGFFAGEKVEINGESYEISASKTIVYKGEEYSISVENKPTATYIQATRYLPGNTFEEAFFKRLDIERKNLAYGLRVETFLESEEHIMLNSKGSNFSSTENGYIKYYSVFNEILATFQITDGTMIDETVTFPFVLTINNKKYKGTIVGGKSDPISADLYTVDTNQKVARLSAPSGIIVIDYL